MVMNRTTVQVGGTVIRLMLASLYLLIGMLALISLPSPAQAHSELKSSQPVDGARITDLPGSIQLVFNQEVSPDFTKVRLIRVSDDATRHLNTTVQGPRVTAEVSNFAPDSATRSRITWRIDYRVVSADAHPISGDIRFTTKAPATPGPEPSDSASPPPPSPSADAASQPTDDSDSPSAAASFSPGVGLVVIGALTGTVALGVASWLYRARARANGGDRQE